MIRILIADDHEVVRQGLKKIISANPDLSLAGEASDGVGMLERAESKGWDVAILDISLPDRSGLEVLQELKSRQVKKPVLILSMHPEEQYAIRALKAGYVNKAALSEELVTAIRKVAGGGKHVSPQLAEKLAFDLHRDSEKLPHESLSDREFVVFGLLASGKTITEIADRLSLSVKTISTYRTRISDKMKLKNKAELIHYACRHRLVEY